MKEWAIVWGLKFTMKKGIVKFSKEFKTMTGNVWLGVENEYDMNAENPIDVFKRAEETIQQYAKASGLVIYFDAAGHAENMPPTGPPPIINIERTSEDKRIAELIRDIYACTQLDGDSGLYTYSKLAASNNEAQAVYAIMEKRLRDKEVAQILDSTNEYYKNAPESNK